MAYEIQKKKSGFYHLFEFNVPGEVIAFETEFRRDERVMRFLTVSLDKHAISWAERRRTKLKSTKESWQHYTKKRDISDILRL
jgi:small subunit ribosomal protein S6